MTRPRLPRAARRPITEGALAILPLLCVACSDEDVTALGSFPGRAAELDVDEARPGGTTTATNRS
jgi:hypothetical protein